MTTFSLGPGLLRITARITWVRTWLTRTSWTMDLHNYNLEQIGVNQWHALIFFFFYCYPDSRHTLPLWLSHTLGGQTRSERARWGRGCRFHTFCTLLSGAWKEKTGRQSSRRFAPPLVGRRETRGRPSTWNVPKQWGTEWRCPGSAKGPKTSLCWERHVVSDSVSDSNPVVVASTVSVCEWGGGGGGGGSVLTSCQPYKVISERGGGGVNAGEESQTLQ